MDLLRRFPDKPFERPASSIGEFDLQAGNWIATAKYDGWRCLIVVGDDIEFWSRHKKKLPVNASLKEAVRTLNLPKDTVIDAEWMCRRPDYKGPELLYLITTMWWEGRWQGMVQEYERWERTMKLLDGKPSDFNIRLPKWTKERYTDFFEWSKSDPSTEGMVLKKVTSTLVGNTKDCEKNGNWVKIKWRAGDDGKTIIA